MLRFVLDVPTLSSDATVPAMEFAVPLVAAPTDIAVCVETVDPLARPRLPNITPTGVKPTPVVALVPVDVFCVSDPTAY